MVADADLPDPMREHRAPPPHEAVAPGEDVRRAHEEVAVEILARKQSILDTKFNGRRQSMESLLEEMKGDSDFSDCPEIFDWAWDEASGQFLEAPARKVEFK